jgi:hypothetical protein
MRSTLIAAPLICFITSAQACGICDEDKVAATYDHAIVTQATAHHHAVAFVAVDGMDGAPVDLGDAVKMRAASLKGIDRSSVRVSISPPALSFAYDPAIQSPPALLNRLQERFTKNGWRFRLIKICVCLNC